MKKLLAVLMGCMLMTGTFASCGSSGSSSESGTTTADSSAAASEKAAENSTEGGTEDGTEDVTDEETTTTKKTTLKVTTAPDDDDAVATTTAKTTSKPADDEPEADPSDFHGGDVRGTWRMEDDEMTIDLTFNGGKDSGDIDMTVDITEEISFSDGVVSFEGEEIPYKFDGKTITVEYEDEEILVLTSRGGKINKNIDGEYNVTGGAMKEYLTAENDEMDYSILIDGEDTYAVSYAAFSYEIDGNKLTLISNMDDDEDVTDYFDVDGDTLSLLTDMGDVNTAKRIK